MSNVRFKKIRSVTLPLLKMEENTEYYVKIVGAMHAGKQIDDKKEAATLASVINLETGEEMEIICPTVLRGIFNEEYPNETYVGRCFEIVKHKVKAADTGALKYNKFTVSEVAEPEAEEATDETADTSSKKKGKAA